MAKRKRPQSTNTTETRSFYKGMVKNLNESIIPEGAYLHARNAVNNSTIGDLGVLGNEPSNLLCTSAPYTVIGAIHVYGDLWTIFSTDDTNSEIGTFDESTCEYTTIVNDPCLNFKKSNPILGGEAKENFDCTWQVYWADDLNPDRSLNIDNVPWIQNCIKVGDCIECTDTTALDCDKIRMAKLTTMPCLKIEQGSNGGELLNGTYQAVIAYTQNEQRVTDYSIPSNLVSLFDHSNVNGSIDIIIESIDDSYEEFELVIIGVVNQQTVAKKLGIYSTRQKRISIDRIDPALPSVPLSFIPVDRPSYERSQGIYRNGDYLIRVAPTSRFSFNYQPLANQIKTQWVGVEYPADYYRKAGTNVSYLRDEVYPFFIRWIYDTYDKSESYHIPGRAPLPGETAGAVSPAYGSGLYFEEFNTATYSAASGTTDDGGTIIAKGDMAYWESSEIYPDNKPDIWDNLCGKPIRHHKMPDNKVINHFTGTGNIVVLGVEFQNIAPPVDNQGNPIPGIIGYEILRGSREGNKTVIAKGLLNNMGAYPKEEGGAAYYQNYPYNDLRPDPFLNSGGFITGDSPTGFGKFPLGGPLMQRDKFTFHSPDTQFKHPFLSAKEVKLYETVGGAVDGVFNEPDKHPEHKIISNFSFLLSGLVGFGIALKSLEGEKKTRQTTASYSQMPHANDWVYAQTVPGGGYGQTTGGGLNTAFDIAWAGAGAGLASTYNGLILFNNGLQNTLGTDALLLITTGQVGDDPILPDNATETPAYLAAAAYPGMDVKYEYEYSSNGETGLPGFLRFVTSASVFLAYWSEGTQAFIDIIQAISRKHQYALQYQSHCFYNVSDTTYSGLRFGIGDASYIGDKLQEFGGITVNNLYRSSCVGLTTTSAVPDSPVADTSRKTFLQSFNGSDDYSNVGKKVTNPGVSTAHYVGLKQRLRNQYGQLDGIIQVPTGSCVQELVTDPLQPGKYISDVIFGGDTYIGRYTEKNTMFYFFDWMYDLPDEFEYDYRLRKMIPYPTYWMDTHDFQVNDFLTGIYNTLISAGGTGILPDTWHNFDTNGSFLSNVLPINLNIPPSLNLIVENAYMYLFNSGVRDFFVESEVNVEYRDWEETEAKRHYDPYLHTALEDLFRTDVIKSGNFYKYDYSLSAGRFYQNFVSWGSMQYRNYDPVVAETCYTFYPNRVIYSLPQNLEQRDDNWLNYLINNYQDFTSRVTTMKSVGKNGAMMLFETESPIMFQGVDTLQTDAGTKITIGDGGLFSQPLQNIVNTDSSYEYGSCQDRLSVINTPAGLFWMSQNQGKIFQYNGQLQDLSQENMKWWFDEFLPYKILDYFPDFELLDNTVIGVGCQSIYDNSYGIVYFAKRDYTLRPEWIGRIQYANEDNFILDNGAFIKLGDPRYFDNASWTISYDPKQKAWVSFHDWHPNFLLPSKQNFMSIKNAGIWKHNLRSDSFCNFYGVDYPFEVELVTPTGQNVNTLKSIEYMMEVFVWGPNGVDRNHVLDFNFDRAVVYNTEQISGELRLNLSPKNDPSGILSYPRVNPNSIDILYSKEEQKYRFNQFWDVTDDRGEYSTARRMMWNTQPNGYIKDLNPLYINYYKPVTERKKFRHYQSNLLLRRTVSGPHNMQLKLVNSKNQYSPR